MSEKTTKSAYSKVLTGTLRKFVEQELMEPPEKQYALNEELALLRHRAAAVVEKYGAAVDKGDEKVLYMVAGLMKDELEAVSRMAQAASKIESANSNQMTVAAMENIIGTIIDLMFDVLRDAPDGVRLAVSIENRIRERISLTIDRGTVSLPSDEIVKLMDGTVPPSG